MRNENETLQSSQEDAIRNEIGFSGLDRQLSSNQTAVSALGYKVAFDFELPSGRTQQIADGIYLTIKKKDVSVDDYPGRT
jgi:hypothetical protein